VFNFIKDFSCIYWDDQVFFCHYFCWYAVLHLMIIVCWTIPAVLGWSQLDHWVWSFWYAAEFCLPIFYWRFLHLCSLKRLACNFLFLLCPCPVCG
jgi:hypothetical protein